MIVFRLFRPGCIDPSECPAARTFSELTPFEQDHVGPTRRQMIGNRRPDNSAANHRDAFFAGIRLRRARGECR